jgi:hypothetical protein
MLYSDDELSQVAYITFKDKQGAETAMLLTVPSLPPIFVKIMCSPRPKIEDWLTNVSFMQWWCNSGWFNCIHGYTPSVRKYKGILYFNGKKSVVSFHIPNRIILQVRGYHILPGGGWNTRALHCSAHTEHFRLEIGRPYCVCSRPSRCSQLILTLKLQSPSLPR